MFILASKSPRRKQILEESGYSFIIREANIDETILLNENPLDYVNRMSLNKAKNISKDNQDILVVGADTIVVYENTIFGKPKNFNDAYNMISTLSGKTHVVYTSISLCKNELCETYLSKSSVTFNFIPKETIINYINEYKPYDKAGSYAIQELDKKHINNIDGDFYTIMGFPIDLFNKIMTF